MQSLEERAEPSCAQQSPQPSDAKETPVSIEKYVSAFRPATSSMNAIMLAKCALLRGMTGAMPCGQSVASPTELNAAQSSQSQKSTAYSIDRVCSNSDTCRVNRR